MSRERRIFGLLPSRAGEPKPRVEVEFVEPARPAKLFQAGQTVVESTSVAQPTLPPSPSRRERRQTQKRAKYEAYQQVLLARVLIEDFQKTQAEKAEKARVKILDEPLFTLEQVNSILIHDLCTADRLSTSQPLTDKQVVAGLNFLATLLSLKANDFQTVYDFVKTAANLLQRSQLGWTALILKLDSGVSTVTFDGDQFYTEMLEFLGQGHPDDVAAKLQAVNLLTKPFAQLLKRGQSL